MRLTDAQFKALFPKADEELLPFLNRTMVRYRIDTAVRMAAFLAQVGHESAGLTRFEENLNYSAEALKRVWPARFQGVDANAYARKPEKIANFVYADRLGNGGEATGDGWRYRGRGLIQITGKANYASMGKALSADFVGHPDLVLTPEYSCLTAGEYWGRNGLNNFADVGDFRGLTKRINGALTGVDDRLQRWEAAKRVLNARG
jgi:putative chitinase